MKVSLFECHFEITVHFLRTFLPPALLLYANPKLIQSDTSFHIIAEVNLTVFFIIKVHFILPEILITGINRISYNYLHIRQLACGLKFGRE